MVFNKFFVRILASSWIALNSSSDLASKFFYLVDFHLVMISDFFSSEKFFYACEIFYFHDAISSSDRFLALPCGSLSASEIFLLLVDFSSSVVVFHQFLASRDARSLILC